MFETSKDILLLVIAFCVLWFTVFLCWLIYYFISMIGSVRKIVKSVQEKIDKIDELIDLVKDKVNSSAAYLPLIVEGVTKLVKHFRIKKGDKEENEEKKSKK